ncbi:hypothetical protein IGI04_042346, partial [Brassica rapa subsp. trilocularis]
EVITKADFEAFIRALKESGKMLGNTLGYSYSAHTLPSISDKLKTTSWFSEKDIKKLSQVVMDVEKQLKRTNTARPSMETQHQEPVTTVSELKNVEPESAAPIQEVQTETSMEKENSETGQECSLFLPQSEFNFNNSFDELTCLEPVQPSSIVSVSQVAKEDSAEREAEQSTQGEKLEQPNSLQSNTTPESLSYDLQKHSEKGTGEERGYNDQSINDESLAKLEMQQSNLGNCLAASFDIGAVRGSYLSNQKELSNKLDFHGNLTHQGLTANWNHVQSFSGERVMGSTSQVNLCLLCLNFSEFITSQSYLWRPDMMHLFLSKEPCADYEEALKHTRRKNKREEDKRFKPPILEKLGHDQIIFKTPVRLINTSHTACPLHRTGLNLPLSTDFTATLEKLGNDQEHLYLEPRLEGAKLVMILCISMELGCLNHHRESHKTHLSLHNDPCYTSCRLRTRYVQWYYAMAISHCIINHTTLPVDYGLTCPSQKMGLACGSARREEKEERGNEWGWFSQMKATLKRCGVWRNHEEEESLKGKAAEKDQTARETSGNCFSLEESTLLEKIEDVYENKISLRRVYEVKKVISGGKPGREEFNNHVRKLQHLWVELQGLRSHVDGDTTQEQETVLKLLASMESSYGWLVEMVLRGEQLPEMEEICGLIRRAYEIMRDDERLTMSRSESSWKPTGSRSESFQKLTMSRSEGSWRLTGSRSEGFRKKRRCRMLSKASINIGKGRKRVVGECSYSAYMGESVEDSGVLREQEKGSGADDRITRKEWRVFMEHVQALTASKKHAIQSGASKPMVIDSGAKSSNPTSEAERTTPLDHERGNGTESHEQVHNQEDSGQHNQEVTQEVESGAQSSGDGQRESTGSDESGTQSSGDWEVDPDGSNESGAQSITTWEVI